MANDRLRTAFRSAGLTIEDVSERLSVDRKTVERWVKSEDRKPHRRTRRQLAKLLSLDEVHLWPDLAEDLHTEPNSQSELISVYPSRSAVPFNLWNELIAGVQDRMDVLVYSGQFLVEQHNVVPVVQRKTQHGVQFRFIVGDEASTAVTQRAMEEGTTGGLEGRIQMMRRYLADVRATEGVSVRTHGTILYNSIYRFDDQLLVNGHAYGALAGQNPVIHLRYVPGGVMWDHYLRSLERVWAEATPE